MSDTCPHIHSKNLISSIQGRFVYKDQCTKCFADYNLPEGIDLCLTCLNGSCPSHSALHFTQTSHPIVLNFYNSPKPKNQSANKENNKSSNITKLAIGKEGGAPLAGGEPQEFELKTVLKCLVCQKEVSGKGFEGIIESVVKADTAEVKSGMVGWELEIKPCTHTKFLKQEKERDLKVEELKKCSSCNLSTNLWLCLCCGNLGCGRKNYDGTGGNGHAMEHYKTTSHEIVVKMGTITPDGNASINCYVCDDDVMDENLAIHLNSFGIKVEEQLKTEKTMLELNLSFNLNLTLSKTIEEGRKLFPVFGEGLTGLENLGNSCYVSSVLQTLFSIPEFRQKYYTQGVLHLQNCSKYPPECLYCQISKVGHGLCSGKYSIKMEEKVTENDLEKTEYYQNGIKIHTFKSLFSKSHPEFSSNRQQDAAEYLDHLLTTLQKLEKSANLEDSRSLFGFTQTTKLVCQNCGGCKLRENLAQELKLMCPEGPLSEEEYPLLFSSLLSLFVTPEIVADVFCPSCNKKTSFLKSSSLSTFPQYILLPIQRFVLDMLGPKKINANIVFDSEVINLSSFKTTNLLPNEFLLPEEESSEKEEISGSAEEEEGVKTLEGMGFGANRSIRALRANGNNVEAAVMWLFERTEDWSLDAPLEKKVKKSKDVSSENVEMVMAMGFSDKQAIYALKKSDNNLERAVDYLFNHPEEIIEESEEKKDEKTMQKENLALITPKYKLQAAIVHLGRSVHCGHYVSYIKHNENWVLFNDRKVALTEDPLLGKAYIYLLKRIE